MHLRHLQVTDFRSWSHADLALEPGCTVLVGRNGRGKTNLLEAIGYLASLSSHRVATDTPLIRQGAAKALVKAAVVNGDREMTVELEINPGKANRARVNRASPTRPREILGILHTVLFAPEDLVLVKGDPSDRRRFLDELLVQRSPRYAGVRADYDRALKQRNALLKTTGKRRGGRDADPYALSTLDVWDAALADAGAQLLAARLDLVTDLAPHAARAYQVIADTSGDGPAAALTYRSSLGAEALAADDPAADDPAAGGRADPVRLHKVLLAALQAARPTDLERGVSTVGPHRDELELSIGATVAKGYASHGESWSLALALRLGSYELLRADASDPVLLLDDVFAELDRRRRQRLAEVAAGAEQVLVTAAVDEDVPEELWNDGAVRYRVTDGRVERE